MATVLKMIMVIAMGGVNYGGKFRAVGDRFEIDELALKQLKGMGKNCPVKEAPKDKKKKEPEDPELAAKMAELIALEHIDEALALKLISKGLDTVEILHEATEEDLVAINGIGKKTAVNILEDIAKLGK